MVSGGGGLNSRIELEQDGGGVAIVAAREGGLRGAGPLASSVRHAGAHQVGLRTVSATSEHSVHGTKPRLPSNSEHVGLSPDTSCSKDRKTPF